MRLGPSRLSPLAPGRTGARARVYSSSKMTCCMKLAPRPPYCLEPDPTRGVHRLLPGDALFQCLPVWGDALVGRVVDADLRRQVRLEPAADLAAECRMLRAVGKIHFRPLRRLRETRLCT